MHIELNREEAELLRGMLQHKVEELDKEINRTDSLGFRRELRQTDRMYERILGRVTAALELNGDAGRTP
ncbi:MAG TPA: hypothetical protein VF198_16530 [Vicinamibacterales bacterium]